MKRTTILKNCSWQLLFLLLTSLGLTGSLKAGNEELREIYVPFKDFNVLLNQPHDRILMSRQEFNNLLQKQKKTEKKKSPIPLAPTHADYQITISKDIATVSGTCQVEAFQEGIHLLPLHHTNLFLLNATLDGKPAPLYQDSTDNKLKLIVSKPGSHTFTFKGITTVTTLRTGQYLDFSLPTSINATIQLSGMGAIRVESGNHVISTTYLPKQNKSLIKLLSIKGKIRLNLKQTGLSTQKEQIITALQQDTYTLTQAYEKIESQIKLNIVRGNVQSFSFNIPEKLMINTVTSNDISNWSIKQHGKQKQLIVNMQNRNARTAIISINAMKMSPNLAQWQPVSIQPLGITDQRSLLTIFTEPNIRAQHIKQTNLIPVTSKTSKKKSTANLFKCYYAPSADYSLTATLISLSPGCFVDSTYLLQITDKQLNLKGELKLKPENGKTYGLAMDFPVDWQIVSFTHTNGKPLKFDTSAQTPTYNRVYVHFQNGLPNKIEERIYLTAIHHPKNWLNNWQQFNLSFPVINIKNCSYTSGIVAIQTANNMTLQLAEIAHLSPVSEQVKETIALSQKKPDIAFRTTRQDYRAMINITKQKPRLTADFISFFKIEADGIQTHCELTYRVTKALTDKLSFILPLGTPETLSVTGTGTSTVKEYYLTKTPTGNLWHVVLTEPRQGTIKLLLDFQQKLSASNLASLALPLPIAQQVDYQSGKLAIEGNSNSTITILKHPRSIDIGELTTKTYRVGKHLIGAFCYLSKPPVVSIKVEHPTPYKLPSALCQSAWLLTLLSANGVSQTSAEFRVITNSQYLKIALPEGSTLWSVLVNDEPAQPQNKQGTILIDLPPVEKTVYHKLKIVYETPVKNLYFWDKLNLKAPSLYPYDRGKKNENPIPLSELNWTLHMPSGYWAVSYEGDVLTNAITIPESGLIQIGKFLYAVGGGIGFNKSALNLFLLPALNSAREKARRISCASNLKQIGLALKQYTMDFNDKYPESFNTLADHEYLTDINLFMCPSCNSRIKIPSESDYTYAGKGLDEGTAPADKVIAYCDCHAKYANVLFLDGHVKGYAGSSFQNIVSTHNLNITIPESSRRKKKPVWAIEGAKSLTITLAGTGPGIRFKGMAASPSLSLSMVNDRRLNLLTLSSFLIVILGGLALTFKSRKTKLKYLAVLFGFACLLPVITGTIQLTLLVNGLFYGISILVPYYILAAIFVQHHKTLYKTGLKAGRALPLSLLLFATLTTLSAAENSSQTPVRLPANTVIIPYDSKDGVLPTNHDKLLVPRHYAEALFAPLKLHTQQKPVIDYAITDSQFSCTLQEAGNQLKFEGFIDFVVYNKQGATIPLPFNNCIIRQALLNDSPAKLAFQSSASRQKQYLLHMEKRGPARLNLSFFIQLTRHGGWRKANGTIPSGPSARLHITIPAAGTELILAGNNCTRTFTAKKKNDMILTAPGTDGKIDFQWRPKVTSGKTDQRLTAKTDYIYEIQPSRLLVQCSTSLQLNNSKLKFIDISVPKDCLAEQVTGSNVSSWSIKKADNAKKLRINLLKSGNQYEEIRIKLLKLFHTVIDRKYDISLPKLVIDNVARQTGQIFISRVNLISLYTKSTAGVTQIDKPDWHRKKSTLYQVFNYFSPSFTVKLQAKRCKPSVRGELRTVMRIAAKSWTTETNVILNVSKYPLFQSTLALPLSLEIHNIQTKHPSAWTTVKKGTQQHLIINYPKGIIGKTSIIINAVSKEPVTKNMANLPTMSLHNVQLQQGYIAVQVTADYDLSYSKLKNIRAVLLSEVLPWLTPSQHSWTKLAFHYTKSSYSGKLQLMKKSPLVSCQTISNVKVTNQSIEESILLDFNIRNSGISQIKFIMPASLKNAHIQVPFLREKQLRPLPDTDAVECTLDFQDKLMKELKVLISHDRLLTKGTHIVPLPTVLTGHTKRQYAAIENYGRDEIVIEQSTGMVRINRQQKEWHIINKLLTNNSTQAYILNSKSKNSTLSFHCQERRSVKTAGARIGLAKTTLFLDHTGSFKAEQQYFIDNQTEQYLEISLPKNTTLYSVMVANTPATPIKKASNSVSRILIPLIKTAPGDLDYRIVLKYGGKYQHLGSLSASDIPLMHTENINVEKSQVELMLPKTKYWFDFGGTMRCVTRAGSFEADILAYKNQLTKRLIQTVKFGNKFSKMRALSSLKKAGKSLKASQQTYNMYSRSNAQVNQEISQSETLIKSLEKELKESEKSNNKPASGMDNVYYFNTQLNEQKNIVSGDSQLHNYNNWSIKGQPQNKQTQKTIYQGQSKKRNHKMKRPSKFSNKVNAKAKKRKVQAKPSYLDLQLPRFNTDYWQRYRFTTPRGDITITARAITHSAIKKLLRLLLVPILIIVIFAITRYLLNQFVITETKPWLHKALITAGIVSLVFGITPIYGGLLLVCGIILKKMKKY